MGPFKHFTACMPDFSSTQENTAHLSAGIIWHICTAYSAPLTCSTLPCVA